MGPHVGGTTTLEERVDIGSIDEHILRGLDHYGGDLDICHGSGVVLMAEGSFADLEPSGKGDGVADSSMDIEDQIRVNTLQVVLGEEEAGEVGDRQVGAVIW